MNKSVFMPETIWPCWAYALRRIGSKIQISTDWVYKEMPKLLQDYDNPQPGEILVWKSHDVATRRLPVYISQQGSIVWKLIKYEYHAAVYEGLDRVSDMIVGTDKDWEIPFIIRMCDLNDLSRPDFIIKGLQNGND